MASTRVINCISYKRFVAVCSLRNVYILSNFSNNSNFRQNALYCTKKSIAKTDHVEHENKIQVVFADVVKENTKSIGYLGVIICGIGITAFMFYMIFDELFSNKSPNSVYSKALDRCIKHPKVTDALGEPIKAYGEESRRGRRSHISHITFEKDGVRHMRMKFYIQGIRRRATVNLEVQEDESGNYMYRYLYVLVDDILQTIIKIEDNREQKRRSITEAELEWN
ncbi:mitochondrial import inner membrane translocase subunit Tim21 [Bombus affinis]|uniref:mitochondrial import inner membrane translocase subunit Tim21 n=1 Tax=Bombus affinis TaxID=309941 RepID=UPI0021B833CB|nr:mitochondrial import inner membrane translocase subunit Tim21 [Bombus affinis]XP_050589967.1 mitochondrial import inner membrane translocase subunit Tim21 [Bombus affinis]XP_050589968.1 mitochondrial import inner membrane translocase subunit Tim21 [Bombus affinis]XP_050589969.1 mitochondrial import inner membrane translocase subunit Tim21 [Bombus affinis]XP_050589971.1 mitochondrial import inner membrane translocase subunit Tim21 [Bombus affinis]XP_050589972.1 mitochondrial import inner mem